MTDRQDATEALALMRQARARANGMRRLPVAYHFAFGALMAGLVLAPSLRPGLVGFSVPLLMLFSAGLYYWQRNATGRTLNGFRSGRTLPVTLLMLATLIALIFISNPVPMRTFNLLNPFQGATIAFVIGTAFDWIWMRIYDREQRAGV